MLPTPVLKRRHKYRCCVPGCGSVYYWPVQFKDKRFHRLPRNPNKRQPWIEILGLPCNGSQALTSMSVCEDHFGEKAFTNCYRERLNRCAKPLPPVPLVQVSDFVEVATSQEYAPNEFSENCVEESVNIDLTSEKIHSRIDVNGTDTAISPLGNELQRKTISEDTNKQLSCENNVYVYELPSGRKVMYYHFPILENLN